MMAYCMNCLVLTFIFLFFHFEKNHLFVFWMPSVWPFGMHQNSAIHGLCHRSVFFHGQQTEITSKWRNGRKENTFLLGLAESSRSLAIIYPVCSRSTPSWVLIYVWSSFGIGMSPAGSLGGYTIILEVTQVDESESGNAGYKLELQAGSIEETWNNFECPNICSPTQIFPPPLKWVRSGVPVPGPVDFRTLLNSDN